MSIIYRLGAIMTDNVTTTADTATQFVDVDGTQFAYRTLGVERTGEPPLVLLHRWRAEMDDWDPLFLDSLAAGRRVIIFNNRGVGATEGDTPDTLEQAADDAAAFIRALGIEKADLLGWSMGGMTTPIVAQRHPELVRRLVLSGTCPPGNPEFAPVPQHWLDVAVKPGYEDEDILSIFFTESESSIRKGRESLARMNKPGQPGSSLRRPCRPCRRRSRQLEHFGPMSRVGLKSSKRSSTQPWLRMAIPMWPSRSPTVWCCSVRSRTVN